MDSSSSDLKLQAMPLNAHGNQQQQPPAPEYSNQQPATGNQESQPQQQRTTRHRRGGLSAELREKIDKKYDSKTLNLVVRCNKLGSQLADFANNVAFLTRCANTGMVPITHCVYNGHVRNTQHVVRHLDQCSFRVLVADLEHNRRRKYQVSKNRDRLESRLREILSQEDFDEVQKSCDENRESHFADVKERQRNEYQLLLDEYKQHEHAQRGLRRPTSRRGRSQTQSPDQRNEDATPPNEERQQNDRQPQQQQEQGAQGGGNRHGGGKPKNNGVKGAQDTGGAAGGVKETGGVVSSTPGAVHGASVQQDAPAAGAKAQQQQPQEQQAKDERKPAAENETGGATSKKDAPKNKNDSVKAKKRSQTKSAAK